MLISPQLYPKALWFEQKESPRLLEGFLNYSRSPSLSAVSFLQLSRSPDPMFLTLGPWAYQQQ
jgi:hypothetical protein